MFVVRIYWNNRNRPPEQSDPVIFGSFGKANRFAEKVFPLNSGRMFRREVDDKHRHHLHGSTAFGSAEVVISRHG